MAKSQQIVDWYYEREFDRAIFDFDDHIVKAVQECFNKDPADTDSYLMGNRNSLWQSLTRRIAEDKERGIYPTFDISLDGVDRLIWYPGYFPPGVRNRDKWQRLRIRSRSLILNEIQRLKRPQYEALSVLACKLSGAARFHLTRYGGDGGVDFFAVIPSLGRSHVFSGGGGTIRIVGQSKMSNNRIPRKEIGIFAETLNEVRHVGRNVKKHIPSWFLRERGPIIGWFVAHSGLQSGAADYANDNGIIHSDSRDIAEIVTMSRAWQPTDGLFAPVELIQREIKYLLNHTDETP